MTVTLDYSSAIAAAVGAKNGIDTDDLEKFLADRGDVITDLADERPGFMDLPQDGETISRIKEFADAERGSFKDLVVIGIGGSALGATALHSALSHPFHDLINSPRLFVMDNCDPARIDALFDVIDPKTTLVNVITKSGSTAETMGTFAIVAEKLKAALGAAYAKNVIATTDPLKGALRKLADVEGFRTFEIPSNVGGRFSVFSAVGLLPAAMVGIDIEALCVGAAAMDERNRWAVPEKNIAFVYAALMYLLDTTKGKSINVMMPYASALADVADWFRQLWAESLGKKLDVSGALVNTGQTPVKALGATDQHSQVQLYVEGPFDKVVTFIRLGEYDKKCTVPKVFDGVEVLEYLAGHTMAKLISASALGTEAALREADRPSVAFELDKLTAENVGALMYIFEMATAYAGKLYNINAFDQPGVEAGKTAARALMGAPGFEKRAEDIRTASDTTGKYRIE